MRSKAGRRPAAEGESHDHDRFAPHAARRGVPRWIVAGRCGRRSGRRGAADGASRRRRPVGRAPRAPRRGDAGRGRRGPQSRHRRADRAAWPRRALQSVRHGGPRVEHADARRQLVPALLDDEADHERRAADAVRGRQVPALRSAREIHPGLQGRAGACRDGRRAHAARAGAAPADDPRRLPPHGRLQLWLRSAGADRSCVRAERRRLRHGDVTEAARHGRSAEGAAALPSRRSVGLQRRA